MRMRILLAIGLLLAFALPPSSAETAPEGYENKRPMFGVNMTPIPGNVQVNAGLEKHEGVYVSNVIPATAAQQMGVQAGDVLVELDGVALTGPGSFIKQVQGHSVGSPATAVIVRNGHKITLSAPFKEWPASIPYPYNSESDVQALDDMFHQNEEADFARVRKQVEDLKRDAEKLKDQIKKNGAQNGIAGMENAQSYRQSPPWKIAIHTVADSGPVAMGEAGRTEQTPSAGDVAAWRLSYHSMP
jgi:membrane-associated protease RseP (regulator of RpoE activity)